MKKLLALILSLIMCFSVFVSCNDEENQSMLGENSNLNFSKDVKTKSNGFYNFITGLTYKKDDLPASEHLLHMNEDKKYPFAYGSYYKIINSYKDLTSMVSNYEKVSPSLFDDNFILVWCDFYAYSLNSFVGVSSFSITDGVARITEFYEKEDYSEPISGPSPRSSVNFVVIPRDDLKIEKSEIIEVESTRFFIEPYDYLEVPLANSVCSDGITLILDSSDDVDEFIEIYSLDEHRQSLTSEIDFDKYLYVAIYCKNRNSYSGIYCFDCYEYSKGSLKLESIRKKASTSTEEYDTFQIIKIPLSDLPDFEVTQFSKIDLTIKSN